MGPFLIWQISYGFLKRPTIDPILTCAWRLGAWRDISKCTEGSWRGAFAVTTKEQLKLEILFVKENKCFEGIPSRPKCVCKFAHCFSSVFTSLQMHCRVFCNLVDSSNFQNKSGNHDIHGGKIHTCSYSGPAIPEKTKETERLFSRNNGKMVNYICDKILLKTSAGT